MLHVYDVPQRYAASRNQRPTAAFVDEIAAAQRAANDRMAAVRAQFDEVCSAHGVPIVEQPQTSGCTAYFSVITGQEEEVSATFGRLSALIVAATPDDSGDLGLHETVQALLMETKRPVLIVPHGGAASIGTSIAIA